MISNLIFSFQEMGKVKLLEWMRMEKQTWVWLAGIRLRRSLIRERERDVEKEKQRSKLLLKWKTKET